MANMSTVRDYPQRFQHDVDIGGGYMHSGYPIMTFLDVVEGTLNTSDPQKWGQFHELGHNHQAGVWTWACTGAF